MRKIALAALVCAAALAGCGSGSKGRPVLDADYAPRFVGVWTGTLVATANGQTQSFQTAVEVTATGVNLLELPQFCVDGSALPAAVSSPSTFAVPGHTCPTFAAGTCSAVTVVVRDGNGSLDGTGKTLSLLIDATESGCGQSFGLTMNFTGTRGNRPPIASVTLTPAAPRATDDITAHVEASDPDGDPLTITYSWARNGSLLPGQTSATLPAGSAAGDDVVTVAVAVSDGMSTTYAQASVTIPGIVLSGTPPAQVDPGHPVSFQLTATTPDGSSPGDFVLEYGPAGMEVSPSGLVTWTPSLPMFDRTLDVHFGVGLAASPNSHFVGTMTVVDPLRELPLYRTGIEIPVWHAGLQVTDLDGDGRAEMLVASATGLYELARSGAGYAQRWAYPFSSPAGAPQAVAARDLDGDGKQEIFFATGDLLVELDGATRREVARFQSNGAYSCRDLRIADIDLDGSSELVCLGLISSWPFDGQVVVLDAKTLTVKWQTAVISSLGATLAVGNVDGDAALEIVTSGGFVFDGITGQNEWAYGPGFGLVVDVGDLDGDGIAEIVGMMGSTFDVFSAVLKSPIKEGTGSGFDALLVTDIDGDGKAEILIGDAQWGNVTAYRYDKPTNALSVAFQIDSQNHGVTSIGVGDVDGDGANEFVWGSGATSTGPDSFVIAGLDPAITVEWTNADPKQLDGAFVGARLARLGGGATRLVYAATQTYSGYVGARLVALDPATGLLQVSKEVSSSGSGQSALDVADDDGDGVEEVLLASSSVDGGHFTAYDFLADAAEWTSPALGLSAAAGAVAHADLNGDGFADLVAVTTDGYVHAYDVRNQALIWKSTGLGSYGVDVAAVDLDGDGTPEIVVLASDRVVVFRRTAGPVGWVEAASQPVTAGMDLLVADCDGDGAPEIFVLTNTFPSGILRFDAALNALGSFTLDAPVQSIHLEDLGAGRKNLVASAGYAYWTTGQYLRAIDPRTGAEIWRSPQLWGTVPINSLSYVDARGDGGRELAFGTTYGMYLTR